MSEGFSLRQLAGHDSGEFYLIGWLPEADGEGFKKAAEEIGCVCSFEKPGRGDTGNVPVKLKESFWSRIFAPFVTMYGYPAYGECDPRIFMVITYCLLFGVMFGDVGQGALLVLIGIYMVKKKGMWLGRILAAVGCAAVVFGFVYGSVFGNEHLLPGFKVLEGSGVMQILLVSAGGGVILILISGVLNIMTSFRQKNYRAALFSANGVTGVLFLAGMVCCAVSDAALSTSLLSMEPIWFVFALLLLSIWLGEPLTMMLGLAPKEHGHKTSVGMMLLEELPASRHLRHLPRHHDAHSVRAVGDQRRGLLHLRPRAGQRARHAHRIRPRMHTGPEARVLRAVRQVLHRPRPALRACEGGLLGPDTESRLI